jgi:hypothetical protein
MHVFTPGPDRWKLGFREAVAESFKFLRGYGYRLVRADVTFVRYEMPWHSFKRRFYVNVYHARGGYDLGVEIGPRDNDREEVNLIGMLLWAGAPEVQGWRVGDTLLRAETREAVQTLVPKMAELVRRYAGPFLRGDPDAFRTLREINRKAYAVWEEQHRRNAEKRHQATVAWQAKDFERVVDLYESVLEDLNELERAALAEARRELATRAATQSGPGKQRA